MIRLAINGAAGRMGRALVEASWSDPKVTLTVAADRPESSSIGSDAGVLAGIGAIGIPIVDSLDRPGAAVDLVVDFSQPQATLKCLALCRSRGQRMVIGTTGFDQRQRETIEAAAAEIAILCAPNMSVGVNLLFKLSELAARALGDSVDVEIIEAHHRHKLDAPSGTALRLGEVIAAVLGRDLAQCAVYGRQGRTGERDRQTIGFETIRGGDIVGDHCVLFAGAGERIELTHRASSRATFALGAMRAAHWLMDRRNGLYDMQDVLGLR
ncbi:MAG: 4-hydroxy-tetrahydrodipicolinate reductase [Gammaproteobacteria bacterium]